MSPYLQAVHWIFGHLMQTVRCNKCRPYFPRFLCKPPAINEDDAARFLCINVSRFLCSSLSSSSGKSWPPQATRPPLLQLFSSPENEKVNALLPPSCFLFTLSEFLNPMVEKESIQWMRLIESENHFYLFLINKITHPLKFIKKWLYCYKVSLSDF